MAKAAGNPARHSSDRAIWAEAMRDVTPLRGRSAPIPPPAPIGTQANRSAPQ